MRTTFNSVNRNTQAVIGTKYADLASLQKQIATGKALNRPSDDPIKVSNVLSLRSSNEGLKQYEQNMNDGLSWMELTDTTMMSMNQVLQRGRELAIKGDSDTLSKTERVYLAEEVEQLTRQLMSLANSQYKGDYMFSGSETSQPPIPYGRSEATSATAYSGFEMSYFDGTSAPVGTPIQITTARGSSVLTDDENVTLILPGTFKIKNNTSGVQFAEGTDYKVDYTNGMLTILPGPNSALLAQDFRPGAGYTNLSMEFDYATKSRDIYDKPISTNSGIYREIEAGVSVKINTSFDSFTVNNSTNMITSMIQLGQSLIQGDQTGIRNSMDSIDMSFNKILSAQSENGAKINSVRSTVDRNDSQQVETTRIQALLEDADFAETVSKYTIAQTVFNAALQSTAKIMQSSLANYI